MIRIAAAGSAVAGALVACCRDSGHPGVSERAGTAWAVDAITALLPLARDLEMTLAMENHYKDGYWRYPEFAQQPDVFLRAAGPDRDRVHFGVQYDPSNAIVAGDDPSALLERWSTGRDACRRPTVACARRVAGRPAPARWHAATPRARARGHRARD